MVFADVKVGKAFSIIDDYDGEIVFFKVTETEAIDAIDAYYDDDTVVDFEELYGEDAEVKVVSKAYAKAHVRALV